MENIVQLENVSDYNNIRGVKTLHPLITVIDLSKAGPSSAQAYNFGLYAVYLKELECGELKYGRNNYDFQEGTLVFIAPGQILSVQPGVKTYEPKGWALLFHPDLIKGTALGRHIQDYSFFSYDVDEALHLSETERSIVIDCLTKIRYETEQTPDKHSKTVIASNIELFLNYCARFYDRQFITREEPNTQLLERFEKLLNNFYLSNKPQSVGLPSVSYCAETLHLSPNYFGDMIKKETGKTAQEYIQSKIIDIAKERFFDTTKSISEVAYELGFRYPQHLTRLFKQKVGVSPIEYRNQMI